MMHFGTCKVWVSTDSADCDCPAAEVPARWRIRAEGLRWDISRYLDGTWVHFMYAPSHSAACQLVTGMRWLSQDGLSLVR